MQTKQPTSLKSRLIMCLLFCFLVSCSTSTVQIPTYRLFMIDSYNNVRMCTTTFIDKSTIITNAHCLFDVDGSLIGYATVVDDEGFVVINATTFVTLTNPDSFDHTYDIALLKTIGSVVDLPKVMLIPYTDDRMRYVGYHASTKVEGSYDVISSLPMFKSSSWVDYGMSGSPIYSVRDNVIHLHGLVNSGYDNHSYSFGVNLTKDKIALIELLKETSASEQVAPKIEVRQ